ncbi:MAG: tetratricopeptide repeat protein [Myxococcota bacterium]
MIQVQCPSCQASYDVDEHRLPVDGLKMRCPKCGHSFVVKTDGTTQAASAPPPRPKKRKMTQVGLGPGLPPPTPKVSQESGAPPAADPIDDLGEIDLPAPMSSGVIADLPAPKAGSGSLDLDPFGELPTAVDLPAPKEPDDARPSGFDPFADMDLPAPMDPSVDLPAPIDSAPGGGIDLPAPMSSSPARGGSDLPALKGDLFSDEIDLPMALTDAELPAPMSLDSALPTAVGQSDLPAPRDDFSDPPIEGPDRVHGGGPIELDLPDGDDLTLDMEVDPGVHRPAPPAFGQAPAAPELPQGPGSPGPPPPPVAPPEPSLDAERVSRDSAELDLPESDDLEFSELPSLEADSEDDVQRMPHPGGEAGPAAAPAKRKRKVDIRARLSRKRPPWLMKVLAAAAGIAVVIGGGLYLGNTEYGLFGVHLVEPFLPASGDVVEVTQAIQNAEATAGIDTYSATSSGLAQLEGALADARLSRALVARKLLHESYFQLRYGHDVESAQRANDLRLHLQRRGDDAPGVHVALAAHALRQGDPTLAASEIAAAQAADSTDAYVDLVAGELALSNKQGKGAIEAFGRALQKDGSARAQWGLARGHRLVGNTDEAMAAAEATQELSPDHAAARVAVAEGLIAKGDTDAAYALVQVPAGLAPGADGKTTSVSRADRSAALSLVARIEEQRGRLGAAREMYEKAVELDASNSWAAVGAARLVLLEGGYSDALARFQTVISAEVPPGAELHPTGKPRVLVEAKLGAAEALVAMDKAGEAKNLLSDLRTEEPVNADVEIWQGKIADAMGDSQEAVRHLRNAITLEPKGFRGYMALAQHYKATKRPGEAVGVLVEAQQNVEITAEVRRLLGEAELDRNRIDEAIKEYEAALEMEPRDSSAQFGLAVAYRRKAALDEAAAALARVEELDAGYPGLPLEKGRLAEANGDLAGAVASYRAALEKTPDDAALRSRLGAVLAMTGELDEAEAVLKAVLVDQPYSAEAEHYLGRVDLDRGDVVSARQHFLQATRLEPQSGVYRLYVAWAALDSGEWTTALRDLNATLKLDPTLGDAYWLRARIRIRAGQVRDALADLQKAIALNPSRTEAWAAIGEAHYQLGQMNQAIAAFEKALEAKPEDGYWWYRLGRLQLDVGQRDTALASLAKAAELGDTSGERPAWLADAYRLRGDVYYAQRERREAVVNYGRYLELSTPDAIDRPDVQAKLRQIGAVAE